MLESRTLLLIYSITGLTIHQFWSSAFSMATQLSFSLQDATGKLEFEICMPVTCKHTTMFWKPAICLWFSIFYKADISYFSDIPSNANIFSMYIKIPWASLSYFGFYIVFVCFIFVFKNNLSLEVCSGRSAGRSEDTNATIFHHPRIFGISWDSKLLKGYFIKQCFVLH